MSSYNGWKNYETWNVALWIGNDGGLYELAKECANYTEFAASICIDFDWEDAGRSSIYYQTPDGVAWNDSGLDIEALDEMIGEL